MTIEADEQFTCVANAQKQAAEVKQNDLREQLAAYAHEAWGRSTRNLLATSIQWLLTYSQGRVIPRKFISKWERQMKTSYGDLPENEKESDRAEADKILDIIEKSREC